MKLGTNYKIESDELQATLFERKRILGKNRNPKMQAKQSDIGKEYWVALGYYFNVAAALRGFLNNELLRSGMQDIETVLKKIDECHALIEAALREEKDAN